MFSKKEIIIFLAGAEASHTISHIFINYLGILPLHFLWINWTQQLNVFAIIANAVITALLLWWASRL